MGGHEGFKVIKIFEGKAKIGEIISGFEQIVLRPEDLSSPISFQMALSRIMNSLMKSLEKGPRRKYVAEVRFGDSMGNTVVFAIDLGENPPLFSRREVKARIVVELYEEDKQLEDIHGAGEGG